MVLIFYRAFKKWHQLLKVKTPIKDKFGQEVLVEVKE
jgi:hypothetical protein